MSVNARLSDKEIRDLEDWARLGSANTTDPVVRRYYDRLLKRLRPMRARLLHMRPTQIGWRAMATWYWRHRDEEYLNEPDCFRLSRANYMRAYRRTLCLDAGLKPRRPCGSGKRYPKGRYRPRVERPWYPPTEGQLAARQRLAHFTMARRKDDDFEDDYSPEQVKARLGELQKMKGLRSAYDEDEDW